MKTRVVFFSEPTMTLDGQDAVQVFAFFPDEDFNLSGDKLSYSQVGQHCGCSAAYCLECDEATSDEYAELKQELESIGYDLEVVSWEDIYDELEF